MKTNPNYVYRNICGQAILIPSCSDNTLMAAIYLNETADAIYCCLKDGKKPDEIVEALQIIYEADESLLRNDVNETIRQFLQSKVLLGVEE